MKKGLLIFLLVIISCQDKSKKKPNSLSAKVTILINNSSNIKTNIGSGIDRESFERMDFETQKVIDTIQLSVEKYLKLYIKNENIFTTIFCEKGDTLVLNITKNRTKIHFKNRVLKKYDTLSLEKIYKINSKELIQNHNRLFQKFMKVDDSKDKIIPKIDVIKSDIVAFRKLDESSEKKLNRKKQVLKNLFDQSLISKVNYENELSQLNFSYFLSIVDSYKISNDDYYLDKIKKNFFENKFAFEDAFISYGYLNVFINQIISKEAYKLFLDYGKIYDILPKYFQANSLKLFREFCLHQMTKQNENTQIVLNYLNIYKNEYNENSFTGFFEKKYLTKEKKMSISSSSVELIDDKSNRISLEEVIKKYEGNLVYVDFWASWCGPCRAEMPSSKKLQNEFQNSKIKFIYISIDTDKIKWEKAFKEELIIENNFFALNYPKAEFYESLKLKTIPRYLLYDTKGKLLFDNAPRPSDKRLRKMILENLNKEIN